MENKQQHPWVETYFVIDPFGSGQSLLDALLATALFRCWHIILIFTAWATLIGCLIEINHINLNIQPLLLTVFGTVLGFVISYRTSSSFERYNEGRRFWSTIILASRTFARGVWFHVPDNAAATPGKSPEEIRARTLVEKKTVLNLVEAFAVAVKHYLRGEIGTNYEDLHHLVRFLPAYDLPPGLPSPRPRASAELPRDHHSSSSHLPLPATSPHITRRQSLTVAKDQPKQGGVQLLPARDPPKIHLFDVFPFTLLVPTLVEKGIKVGGRKAQRERARMGQHRHAENIPLEITLYLSSYIAALQARKATDVPTTNLLLGALGQLVDSLTGLERILTTPIPFSYSIHLWTITVLYVATLPFQIWAPLRWVAIPATSIAAFIFFGFLMCGEEIENPFGFDRNDLNLDHFTHNIIRVELQALTSLPVPDPAEWAFAADNDSLFDNNAGSNNPKEDRHRLSPEQWVRGGVKGIRDVLKGDHKSHFMSDEGMGGGGLKVEVENYEPKTRKEEVKGGGGGGLPQDVNGEGGGD